MTQMIQMNVAATAILPSTASATSSSISALLGAGADLATVIFAMQIEQYDGMVRKGLDEIDQARKLRDSMSTELDRLRRLKGMIGTIGAGNGDQQHVNWNLNPIYNQSNDGFKGYDEFRNIPLAAKEFKQDPDGRVTVIYGDQLGGLDKSDPTKVEHKISMAEVDAAINKIQTKAQALDSDREIKMIMLNQFLNKKEQATTQLTNIIKKTHDTRSAIVANLK